MPDVDEPWETRAACHGKDTAIWFPESADLTAALPALAICWLCPVREECLADALSWPAAVDFGIRGGMVEAERQEMRRQRRPAAGHPGHGTVGGYMWERRHGRPTCPACRNAEARYRWALQLAVLPPEDDRHGTARGYRLGCRCEPCCEAEKDRQERYRGRRHKPKPGSPERLVG